MSFFSPGRVSDELAVARTRLPLDLGLGEERLDGRGQPGRRGHGTTAAGMPAASEPLGDGASLDWPACPAGLDVDLVEALGRAVPPEQRGVLDGPAAQLLALLRVQQQGLEGQRPHWGCRGRPRGPRRRRPRWAGRRRPRRRRGCRRPAPRRRPARTTPSAKAPPRGRRRGTSRPARPRGTGGTNRTWALMPSPSASSCEPARVGQARSGRAAEDRHDELARPVAGGDPSSSAAALTSTSGALSGWIRPTNSSTLASWGSPTAARAARTSPGREQRQVHPGRHDDHLVGLRGIQVDQLVALAQGVGDEAVRRLDDLDLTDLATGAARGCRPRRGGGS